ARVERLPAEEEKSPEVEARLLQLRERAAEALQLLPQTPQEFVQAVQSFNSAGALADLVAGLLDIEAAEKQSILETVDVTARVDRVLQWLNRRIEVLRLSREIDERTKASMDERQREFLLREQMKQIQQQLGEGNDIGEELKDLAEAIEK